MGAPEVFSSTFPPLPAHLPWSTHRIWYKLKTKLGPRKTAQREVSVQGPCLSPWATVPLTLPLTLPVEGVA